jgi:CARDB
MLRTIIASFILLASSAAASAATCSAPAITNVVVKNVDTVGNLNHYQIAGTVVNNGPAQASNVLQAVDIYQGTVKLDTRSIPPLKAGQSYAFTYTSDRASDAGKGTTTLKFQLDPAPSSADCSGSDLVASLNF